MKKKSLDPDFRACSIRGFRQLYAASPAERRGFILQGVDAASILDMASLLGLSVETVSSALRIAPATARRKARNQQLLAVDQGERLLGLQRLVGHAQSLVERGGDPSHFDAGAWAGKWLTSPQPALGGACPIDYLDTNAGQEVLSALLECYVSGAYA